MGRTSVWVTTAAALMLASVMAVASPDDDVRAAAGMDTVLAQQAIGGSNTLGPGDPLPGDIMVTPAYGNSYASDDEVENAVGDVALSMDKCPPGEMGQDQRVVRVGLSKSDFESAGVVNSLLLRAAKFAWGSCPETFPNMGFGGTPPPHYDVSEIDFYLPDGTPAFQAALGMNGQGDGGVGPGHLYTWHRLSNLFEINRQVATQNQAASDRAAALAQQQQDAAQQESTQAANNAKAAAALWTWVWTWLKIIAFVGFLIWLFTKRDAIALWYYLNFHPHPAAPMVASALSSEEASVKTARSLAETLRELPPEGRMLRQARLLQAERLVAELRAANAARARAFEALARKKFIQDFERAAFIQSQEAIAYAVVALEQAKATYAKAASMRR